MSVNTIESFEIDGKLYVNAKFLSVLFQKSEKQIGRWKKDGLPLATKPLELKARGDFYHIEEVKEWVDKNINKAKSRATQKKSDIEIEISEYENEDTDKTVNDIQGKIKQANEMLQLKSTSHDDADRIKKILDGLIQAVKLGEQTKELIPKKDTEKVIVEVIATLISGYKRDLKILPKECAMRAEEEIRAIQESAYKSNIERYQKIAKSKILSENKIYDILEIIYEMIGDDVSIDEIIKKIKT